jgi:hypothetical protein
MAISWLSAQVLWGSTSPEPTPSTASRQACPGVTAALVAADHFKLAASALAGNDIATAVAEARRADAAVTHAKAEGGQIPNTAATAELRAQLGSLVAGIGQGTALILDPSLSPEPNTIDAANRAGAFVLQREGLVARISATTTCPAPGLLK